MKRLRLGLLAALVMSTTIACAPPDSGMVESSDRELRALAEELLPGLSERSGLELREPVRLERRSRDELERYLQAKLDDDLPPQLAERLARSYHLLGLAPADLDLRNLLLAVYREQVAGFYDPDSTALFVLDDQPRDALVPLLLHELVHAVQDQTVDLDALTSPELGNDRRKAAQAVIEGHATLVMMEYTFGEMRGEATDISQIPDIAEQLRPSLTAIETQFPALAGAPAVVRESLLFPYLEGAGYVLASWRDGSPRGITIGDRLPESTEQVLEPSRAWGETADGPTSIELAIPGAEVLHTDDLGRAEMGIMLRELTGDPDARAVGWDGDRYALVRAGRAAPAAADAVPTQGAGPTDAVGAAVEDGDGLVWATVWDDPQARDAFVARLDAVLDLLPAAAALESLDLEGRAVALLRVGYEGPVDVGLLEGVP